MAEELPQGWPVGAAEVRVFKADRRSRVWEAQTAGGSLVVKRFEYSPLRQLLGGWLGVHPAQRERRAHQRLQQVRFPVVAIAAGGRIRWGLGCKHWLAYPYIGPSLQQVMEGGDWPRRRDKVIRAVAALTAGLHQNKLFNRDHKATNILIDDTDRAWLTDVGGVRGARAGDSLDTMLAAIVASMARAGVGESDRQEIMRVTRELCD